MSPCHLPFIQSPLCRDINPQAPVHFLVIPKNRDGLTQLSKSTDRHEPLLGHLIHVASKVARQGDHHDFVSLSMNAADCKLCGHHKAMLMRRIYVAAVAEGCDQGFRTVINDGPQGCK